MYKMEITFRVEILILIVIVVIILFFTTFSSCCHSSIYNTMKHYSHKLSPNQHQFQLEMSYPTLNEGFTGANTNYGESSVFSDTKNVPINTSVGKGAEYLRNK